MQRNSITAAEWDPADDWTQCAQGHAHWGTNGAAGMLLRHTDENGLGRYFLQQRGPHVQHPGTWSTPGGAINTGESPLSAAMRESQEELGQFPAYNLQHLHTNDHGGWAYHTVTADVPHPFYPHAQGWDPNESSDAGWFTPHEIDELPLHPGFRESWNQFKPNQRPDPHREIWSATWSPPLEEQEGSTEPTPVMNPEDHWPEWGERPPDWPKHIDTDFGWGATRT